MRGRVAGLRSFSLPSSLSPQPHRNLTSGIRLGERVRTGRSARGFTSQPAAAPDASTIQTTKLSRLSVRLAFENTYLSYTRNAIISTVAGGALVQYHKAEGKPPLAGTGMLCMGGLFMYTGSLLYAWQVLRLRSVLRLGRLTLAFSLFNALWPMSLWSLSFACLLDEIPPWLIEALRTLESHLPNALRASLFLDPPALYPVCRLLQGVIAHEKTRLSTVRGHAAGKLSLTKPRRAPLTDLDVASIVVRRLERFEMLQEQLNLHACSERAVPTAVAVPLLEKLRSEVGQLEKVLEADMTPQWHSAPSAWWLATFLSTEHRRLSDELDAVRALQRRIVAVKFTSVEWAARGQAGVKLAPEEELALNERKKRVLQ